MGTLDKNERRPSRYGAWDFIKDDTNVVGGVMDNDMREKIKRSFGNTVQVPVLDAETVTISDTRSCTVADDENTSKLVTLSFKTLSFGFTMAPRQHFNNDIDYQADFDAKLKKYLLQLAVVLDTDSLAEMENQKNIFWDVLTDYYSQVGNALQVPAADQDDYYNKLTAIMESADFYGATKIVSNTQGSPQVRRLDNQGSNNGTNQSFQMSPYEWYWTNRLLNGAGVNNTQFAIQEGSMAFETRVDPDSMMRSRSTSGKEWDVVEMPIPGSIHTLQMGSIFSSDCADLSSLHAGTTGLTASLKQSFQFSTDVVYVTAYNSDPVNRYSPIIKVEQTIA
jgi:hypothetical protein